MGHQVGDRDRRRQPKRFDFESDLMFSGFSFFLFKEQHFSSTYSVFQKRAALCDYDF
jgi:hypothetical protein